MRKTRGCGGGLAVTTKSLAEQAGSRLEITATGVLAASLAKRPAR